MGMSCNGCRILRKGCSNTCILRPCLEWIKSPDSQANATVFLAKFYGRAGLLNLINAGPEHLRPAVFRSLLYEACGRIVNPTYGSAGLLWSASWQLCHDAVEAVLNGEPIVQAAPDSQGIPAGNAGNVYDIRHVSKEESAATQGLHRVKTRGRFKARKPKGRPDLAGADGLVAEADGSNGLGQVQSHDSSLGHHSELVGGQAELDSGADGAQVELTLRLGIAEPGQAKPHAHMLDGVDLQGPDTCNLDLELLPGI